MNFHTPLPFGMVELPRRRSRPLSIFTQALVGAVLIGVVAVVVMLGLYALGVIRP